ncbi:MAG: ABC transporter family substrate-binding protein [Acidimicrobiaceae bacterium]|nr:ABC transporter family substrate-binding protein [Acidimicrobiaceae bacterium]
MSRRQRLVFDKVGWKRSFIGASILLTVVLVASCGSSEGTALNSSTTVSTTTTLAPQQTQITYAAPYLPTNFNPNTPAGDLTVTRQIMTNIWPSVFYENSKFETVLNSSFVSSAELVSTNPEVIIYQINPQAQWSDGVPISASDFVYNWMAQSGDPQNTDLGGYPYLHNSTIGYSDIKSVTGSNGGKTVTIIFKKYFSEWEHLFNPIVPAHIATEVGWNLGFAIPSSNVEVSGGPYQISAYVPGQQIDLTRNPKYWGKAATIPKLVFLEDPNPQNYAAQFQNGTINLVDSPANNILYSGLKSLPTVKTKLVSSLTTEELIFNLSKTPLSDSKLRQAIALAIDRKSITSYAIGSYDSAAQPAGNNVYPPGVPQYQDNSGKYFRSDPKAAAALLTSDGYVRSSNGVMTKGGQPLVLTISVDSSNQQLLDVEEMIVQDLSAIGIVVNPVNYQLSNLEETILNHGAFDMAIVTQSGSADAAFHVSQYISAAAGSLDNYSGYSSSAANALIAKAATELDPGSSAAIYNQLDQLLWKDLPSLPLYSVPDVLAFSSGYNFIGASSRSSTIFWNSSTWSFITPK